MECYRIVFITILFGITLLGCTKKEPEIIEPKITDDRVEVTATSAFFTWTVEWLGNRISVVEISSNAEMSNSKFYGSEESVNTNSFSVIADDLKPTTKYYYRFWVWNQNDANNRFVFEKKCFSTLVDEPIETTTTPTVITTVPTNMTAHGVTLGGNVTENGGLTVTERGVCWSTDHNPTTSGNHKAASSGGMGEFTVNITDLIPYTNYYVRAYATNSAGTSYGNEKMFIAGVTLPTVTTTTPSNVTSYSAVCGGEVSESGGVTVTERGVCWSIGSNPTTSDSHQTASAGGTGSFTMTIEGLNAGVTYHVRAYAINSQGKSYGEDKTFTTCVSAPMVSTLSVWNVSMNAASCEGNVIDGGGVTVTERGMCWSTDHNPTTSGDHKAASLAGTGEFTVNVTGLIPNTNYYVRAYAKNSEGTNYGSELFFRTLSYPMGAINGLFSVSAIQQVWFSQGNLQYIGSARTWKFADHQWDVIGVSQGNSSQSTTRDLFGWGTSGYNHGAVCYQPWSISKKYEDYFAYGQYTYNLFDQAGQADWGYNAISNGGNQTNQWRTLTHEEWIYVFNTRITSSGIRYAKAKVDNVNGVILLPDEWNTSFYSLSNANDGGASFTSNTISDSQWADLEQHGAVFLPAAGDRYGTSVGNVGSLGFYWSSSCSYSDLAYHVFFSNEGLGTDNLYYREYGQSVRLVCSSW